MAEDKITVKSVRAPKSVIEKFDELAKGFGSQGQALEAIISSYSLSASAERAGYKGNASAMAGYLARIQDLYAEAIKAAEDVKQLERLAASRQAESLQAALDAALSRALEAEAKCEALEAQLKEAATMADIKAMIEKQSGSEKAGKS